MNDVNKKKASWKQKVFHEMIEYYINVMYLAVFFGLFTWYKRLILAHHQIIYLDYGVGVIEALVLAKVIMIGDVLRIGRRFRDWPLIYPTLFRAVVFGVWVGLFKVLEQTVLGLLRGKGLAGGFEEIMGRGKYELLADSLVTFFAFIPFFAFRELGRVLGEGKLSELFFRRRTATESNLPIATTHPST
jgi:hypothetical protein